MKGRSSFIICNVVGQYIASRQTLYFASALGSKNALHLPYKVEKAGNAA
jgi:hypothetical protein